MGFQIGYRNAAIRISTGTHSDDHGLTIWRPVHVGSIVQVMIEHRLRRAAICRDNVSGEIICWISSREDDHLSISGPPGLQSLHGRRRELQRLGSIHSAPPPCQARLLNVGYPLAIRRDCKIKGTVWQRKGNKLASPFIESGDITASLIAKRKDPPAIRTYERLGK